MVPEAILALGVLGACVWGVASYYLASTWVPAVTAAATVLAVFVFAADERLYSRVPETKQFLAAVVLLGCIVASITGAIAARLERRQRRAPVRELLRP